MPIMPVAVGLLISSDIAAIAVHVVAEVVMKKYEVRVADLAVGPLAVALTNELQGTVLVKLVAVVLVVD